MHPITSIVLLGAGNVAGHLGRRLQESGCRIRQVYNRTAEPGQTLARDLGVPYVGRLPEIDPTADLYVLAVSDSAIAAVARQLQPFLPADALVVHCSGAIPSEALAPFFSRWGVFYPLQSFTRGRPVDFSDIPICLFANQTEDEAALQHLAVRLSRSVHRIDDRQRAILHVAAVFVNNFVNHCCQIGFRILQKEQLSFDLLRPLLRETAAKAQSGEPAAMQTGPAVRNDRGTIDRHLQYLDKFPAYRDLYALLTRSIQEEMGDG